MLQRRSPLPVVALCAWLLLACAAPAWAAADCGWQAWATFKAQFLSDDGRVIDPSTPRRHTVSEGQAYALFFALVGNDRASFERILIWTENNLAQGDFTAHLPAWQWGRRDDGHWGVIDRNPAADADLWIAYTLLEAGRLWQLRRYSVLGALIAKRIVAEETAPLPGLGPTLLPGPYGFHSAPDRWRLNPSYLPVPILRRLAAADLGPIWTALLASSLRVIIESAPKGFAPDWTGYQANTGFQPDQQTQAVGGYDAIRVYLWVGLMDAADPARARLIQALTPMIDAVAAKGDVPESIDTRNGQLTGTGASGFRAALLPLLRLAGESATAAKLSRLIDEQPLAADAYYGQALMLFAQAGGSGAYRFDAGGRLIPRWSAVCAR